MAGLAEKEGVDMYRRWLVGLCCGMMLTAWNWGLAAEGGKAAGHGAGKGKPAVEKKAAEPEEVAKDKEEEAAPAEKEAAPAEKEAVAEEKKPAAKEKAPAKAVIKAPADDAGAEEKPVRTKEEFALDLDADAQALAEQVCPKLVQMREQFDYVMAQYVESRRNLGFSSRKRAERTESKQRAEIQKMRLDMEKEAERCAAPFEKARKTMKQREAGLTEKIDKAMEKNQSADKLLADIKKIQDAIGKSEKAADLVQDIGKPKLNMQRWDNVVLYERIKPGEVEESYLLTIIKKFPELTQTRLDIDNYLAEIAALKEKGDGGAKLEKFEKGLEETAARLKELYEKTDEGIRKDAEMAKAEIAKLEPKAEQMRGKPQGAKAEQEIARLNTAAEGLDASLGMLKRFVSLEAKDAKKPAAAPAKPKKTEEVAAKEKKPEAAAADEKDAKEEKAADKEKNVEGAAEEKKAEADKEAEADKPADKKKDGAAAEEEEKPKAKKGAAAKAEKEE